MWKKMSIFGEHSLEEPPAPSTKSCCCYWPCTVSTAFPEIPYLVLARWVGLSIFVSESLFHRCVCSLFLSQNSWLTASSWRCKEFKPSSNNSLQDEQQNWCPVVVPIPVGNPQRLMSNTSFPYCHNKLNLRGKGVGTSSLTVTEGRRGPAHTNEIWGPNDFFFFLLMVTFFWW